MFFLLLLFFYFFFVLFTFIIIIIIFFISKSFYSPSKVQNDRTFKMHHTNYVATCQ